MSDVFTSKTVTLSADDLDSLWTALEYTRATVAQNNWAGRSAEQTEWALVHAGRASSSERFMRTWIERVDALRKGVQNSPAETRDEWRPIATAPKDREILISGGTYSLEDYGDMDFSKSVCIARWYRDHWRGEDAQAHDVWRIHEPTHWMEIPSPPKAGEKP